MRPLYADLANAKILQSGNAGLWYDKFCDQWGSDPKKTGLARWCLEAFKDVNPKLNWIKTVTDKPAGEQRLLDEAADRQALLLRTYGQTPLFFKTDWHFVTGLGREHPVENGFAWHHSLGVPYLPGSSVKGMVRAWAEYWLEGEVDRDYVKQIFGPRDDAARNSPASGSVIFLDALPIKPVSLKADVMTPHYAPYYQESTGKEPPADWHSPIPIPFLVVAPETTFQFGLLPRRQDAVGDIATVTQWLAAALVNIGTGAKTAVGYGRMDKDAPAEKEYEARLQEEERQRTEKAEKARLAGLTPERRKVEEVEKMFKNPASTFDDVRGKLMSACADLLKKAQKWQSHDDRTAAADLLEEIYSKIGSGNETKKRERQEAIEKLRQPIPG